VGTVTDRRTWNFFILSGRDGERPVGATSFGGGESRPSSMTLDRLLEMVEEASES